MSKVSDLYGLQEIDLEIDDKRAALIEAEEAMGESEELIATRTGLEEQKQVVQELQKRMRDAEWQVDDLTSKLEPVEKKLYGGSVRNPKELAGIEEDVKALQARKRKLEDQALEVMSELEDAEGALTAAEQALVTLEGSWRDEQAGLLRKQEALRGDLGQLEKHRLEQSRLLDPSTLSLYGVLRSAHQGRAVAKVERGMCQGCRISLPMTLLQKARGSGDALVQCSSCERILYVS
jgi:predicted  nucleic acid-binding Zn-ribbon protein